MSIQKVLVGVLAGAVSGAVAGVLFAPHKGKSTRRRILKKKDSYVLDVEKKFKKYSNIIRDKMEDIKLEISNLKTNNNNNNGLMDDAMTDVIKSKIK